jgi:hypothetical protein
MGTDATAKTTGILWGVVAKAIWALRAAPFVVLRRSIVQVSKMLTLQGSERQQLLLISLSLETDGANSRINRRRLLLSLKLWGSAIERRCMTSRGILGGVTEV